MKIQWKKLIVCIAIPLIVGIVSAFLTRNAMEAFTVLDKPPLSPPGILFPIVWTILYVLMGIASYLILISDTPYRSRTALTVYGVQLFFNFCWSLLFFNLEAFWHLCFVSLLPLPVSIFTFSYYKNTKLKVPSLNSFGNCTI